jgi:hypothetical protein
MLRKALHTDLPRRHGSESGRNRFIYLEVVMVYVALGVLMLFMLAGAGLYVTYDRGEIRKRKKMPSKKFRDEFGHTPVTIEEEIPWKCRRLVIATGTYGRLPIMKEVKLEAERRRVELVIVPTSEAIRPLEEEPAANAILHLTCSERMPDRSTI